MEERQHKPCKTCTSEIMAVKKESRDKHLRLTAEFENFKKRQEREMVKFKQFTVKEIMKDILPVVDSLEEVMATFYADDVTIRMLAEGVDATMILLNGFLETNNVKPFSSLGEKFDPNVHKSIGSRLMTKYPRDTVVEVFRKGYVLNDVLLRPADVMISKKIQ